MATQNWDWIFHTLGWTLAGFGLLLALWALFWDRSRGRKRCPKCWYSMEGAKAEAGGGYVCPECGRSSQTVRALHRTRRRKRWLIGTLVLFVAGYATAVIPAVRRGGWPRAIPSSLLVFVAPVGEDAWIPSTYDGSPFDSPKNPMLVDLVRRAKERELSLWQWRVFLGRYFDANANARKLLVQTRDRWPVDHDVAGFISLPWFALTREDDVIVRTRLALPESQWTEHKKGVYNPNWLENFAIGTTNDAPGIVDIEYEFLIGATVHVDEYDWVTDVDASTAKRVWRGIARSIQIGGTPAEIMTPVPNDVTADELARSLKPTLSRDENGRVYLSFWSHDYHPSENGIDWALGLTAEVIRSGEVVATGRVLDWLPDVGMNVSPGRNWNDFELDWRIEPPTGDDVRDGEWTIRLVSDVSMAVLDYDRDSYWVGEIEVPLRGLRDTSR